MSDIEVDTSTLRYFASQIESLTQRFTYPAGTAGPGGPGIVPTGLHSDPALVSPDIGQHRQGFQDAKDLYNSYESFRFRMLGDPKDLAAPAVDPLASSLAAFVSGLQHLSATARAIAKNYDDAQSEEKFGVDQVDQALNADLLQGGSPQPGTGTG